MLGPDLDWALLIVPESTLCISDLVQFMAIYWSWLGFSARFSPFLWRVENLATVTPLEVLQLQYHHNSCLTTS